METTNRSKNGALTNGHRYAFDNFEIDPANRLLLRDGQVVPLTGKVFDVLLVFAENPGRLLGKDELIEKIWQADFVEEGNLARNVSTLRKALGDAGKDHKYIVTVPGHGYRFVANVVSDQSGSAIDTAVVESTLEAKPQPPIAAEPEKKESHKILWAIAVIVVLFAASWFGKDRLFISSPTVKSLAVLPLRGIDPNDNYLGFGITETIIRRISSSGQLAVRPTSAVIHYLNQEPDSLAAARELNADAVLEGTVQRFGDKMRVSVNLLRTADGISIWNENFNMRADDVFRIQDEVAVQVANKLKIRLGSSIVASANDKYPVDQRAYEFYLKGMFGLDAKGFDKDYLPQMENTIDLFQQAINIDPNYAMAHGQLAYSYAWMASFIQSDEPKWADLARQEIATAEKMDPNVAEVHIASGLLAWSSYGGYKTEDAIKEFRLAKQLNPGYNGGDLIALYGHAGLDEQAEKELKRGLTSDPTSQALNGLIVVLPYLRGDVDAWYALHPEHPIEQRGFAPWYLLYKGDLELAQKVIDDRLKQNPEVYDLLMERALLMALKGNFSDADKQVTTAFEKVPHNSDDYHHETYLLACIKSVEGDSAEAVKWLRETANTGYPDYPLFARDPFLDRIRETPEFIQFMSEQRAQHDRFLQEFSD
ncbi:MAG TPA: winged helix-turn-helix domain-containing protein [Pyrinomonadaceae bacterium]|nr:winged helix-turn-helix domain-containing protein [Pyrinomonadaceae bacterium]